MLFPTSGNPLIDALIVGQSWDPDYTVGLPVTVTYSFMTSAPRAYWSGETTGWAPTTAAEQAGISQAVQMFSQVSNISFKQVSSGGGIQYGTDIQSGSDALTEVATSGNTNIVSAHTEFLTTGNWQSFIYFRQVILHELGNAVGLVDVSEQLLPPGSWAPAISITNTNLQTSYNNLDYTVMGYTANPAHAVCPAGKDKGLSPSVR